YIGNAGGIGGIAGESQTIRVGTAQTKTFIAGINTAGVSGTAVVVDANGQLGITLSSARYKRDIAPMGTSSEKVLALRPVTFAYKDDAQGVTRYGLIAEEVATVYPELVTRTASGEVQTVKYHELIPMLLNELQHEHQALEREHQARQEDRAEMVLLRKELAELCAPSWDRGWKTSGWSFHACHVCLRAVNRLPSEEDKPTDRGLTGN